MLIKFSIQNFGSIKEKQTLSFEANKSPHLEDYYVIRTNGLRLLKLGLIYGANASGKTMILKALQFLRDIVLEPNRQKTEPFNFEPFLFDTDTPRQTTFFEIEFIQNETRYLYEVELNWKTVLRETLYNRNLKSKVFERTTDVEKQLTNISFGSKTKIDKVFEKTLTANTLWNNTVLGGFLKTNIEWKELADATNWFKNYLHQVIYPQTALDAYTTARIDTCAIDKKSLLDILKKADLHLSDILVKKEEETTPNSFVYFFENHNNIEKIKDKGAVTVLDLRFEHMVGNNSFILPFNRESRGTQRYYGLAGILYLSIRNSALFPIDELESSLHPELFVHFLLSFLVNSKSSQIIATTHNREILNNKDLFRNDAIWITDKSNDGCATELYSLADFDTKVIRDTTNIYNAYKIGKLGGVPNLGDYYMNPEDENK
jgi:AAA15 family ATPase/GTPase